MKAMIAGKIYCAPTALKMFTLYRSKSSCPHIPRTPDAKGNRVHDTGRHVPDQMHIVTEANLEAST